MLKQSDVDPVRPLVPLVELANTGQAPDQLAASETALGLRKLFILVKRILDLILEDDLPLKLDPSWSWCKGLPALFETYPELGGALCIYNDNTLGYANSISDDVRRGIIARLGEIYHQRFYT